MKVLTINPQDYQGIQIDSLSDLLSEIIEDSHGISIDTLSFSIEVFYTEKEGEEESCN